MGWSSPEEFAARAALGMPAAADLDRDDIAALIEKITSSPGPEANYCIDLLDRSFPYAAVTDVLYWPDRERTNEESADEIVLRKQLFHSGGIDAVTSHIASLANGVMANPQLHYGLRRGQKASLGKIATDTDAASASQPP